MTRDSNIWRISVSLRVKKLATVSTILCIITEVVELCCNIGIGYVIEHFVDIPVNLKFSKLGMCHFCLELWRGNVGGFDNSFP